MSKQRPLSVCIPTYDMGGVGHVFLQQSFDILLTQTFKDFDVVISDYSETTKVKEVCDAYARKLEIHYFKNIDPVGGMSANVNNAIRRATGKILKILFQDDFLYNKNSLELTVRSFDLRHDQWLVTACEHSKDGETFYRPHKAKYNHRIHTGKNTIGSPSVLTIKNDTPLLFDVNLKWLTDCDYYKRCFQIFGKPKIIRDITVAIRIGEHQITNTEATEALRKNELDYVLRKHHENDGKKLLLNSVTVVAVTGLSPAGAVKALVESMKGIRFGQALLVAHEKPDNLPEGITFKQCDPSDLVSKDRRNTNDYSKFIAYRLHEFIETDFALIVHNDAFVVRPKQWTDEFFQYDYIGAPWPPNIHFTNEGVNVRVGNGGFSLRSKRMLRALIELNLPFTDNGTGYFHEDGILCVYYRKKLEEAGFRFAPVPVAGRFSLEKRCHDSNLRPFGFHNNKQALPLTRRLFSRA